LATTTNVASGFLCVLLDATAMYVVPSYGVTVDPSSIRRDEGHAQPDLPAAPTREV
jgi:hypothetical protein